MKKPSVTVAEFRIGGPKREAPAEGDDAEAEAMDTDAEAKRSAARDLMRAMKDNSVDAVVAAMDAFNEACGYGEPEPDEDDKGADDGDGSRE